MALEADRAAHTLRETALLDANARLLNRVDELSMQVSKLQTQVLDLTRAANQHVVRGAGGSAAFPPSFGSPMAGASTAGGMASSGYSMASPLHAVPTPRSPAQYTNGTTHTNTHTGAVGMMATAAVSGSGVNSGSLLAVIDRSVDTMKATAAEDLERYTGRLKSRLQAASASEHEGSNGAGYAGGYDDGVGGHAGGSSSTNVKYNGGTAGAPTRMVVTPPPAGSRDMSGRAASLSPSATHSHTHVHGQRVPTSISKDTPMHTAVPGLGSAVKGDGGSSRFRAPTIATTAKSAAKPTAPSTVTGNGVTTLAPPGSGYASRAAASRPGGGYTIQLATAPPSSTAAITTTHSRGVGGVPHADHPTSVALPSVSTPAGMVTPARPEVRAAPYDDYHDGSGSGGEGEYEREAPQAAHTGRSTASVSGGTSRTPVLAEASVGSTPVKSMSAPDFFKLLRSHVPATALQRLMTALSQHQSGTLSRTDLMSQAGVLLRPTGGELRAGGLTPAPVDLVAAFDTYLHK